MRSISLVQTSRSDVSLIPFTPAAAGMLFELISSNREHLSQFGDETSEKYPDQESVLKSVTNPVPERYRFGVWYSGERPTLVGTVNAQRHPIQWMSGPLDAFDVGYWIGRQYGRRGFATLAVTALVGHLLERFGPVHITAHTHRENVWSRRVLERAGFQGSSHGSYCELRSDYLWFVHHSSSAAGF